MHNYIYCYIQFSTKLLIHSEKDEYNGKKNPLASQ